TVVDTNDVARLAEGLDRTGRIGRGPMKRNAEAVSRFAEKARELGADEIVCTGTMALRNAANAETFVRRVKKLCGVDVRILPGEEEARLSSLAVLSGLPAADGDFVIFDTGGGSTEFIYGRGTDLLKRFSVNVGSVRLTENFLKSDPVTGEEVSAAIAEIDREFADAGVSGIPQRIVGIGGNVTTMAAVKQRLAAYDPEVIQGSTLTREDVASQIAEYASRTLEQRKDLPGLPPKRADIILAGACIVKVILDRLGCAELTVSDRGLRHGLAYELFRKE
ncbi:MAG: Ppx/GppA family phosphatase, partial [Firmicutes bacterium]|nr:Ppx/GppA family phosphatase [Bacillota bacterium]